LLNVDNPAIMWITC